MQVTTALNDREVEEFVRQPYLGVLSTVSPPGKPQSKVVSYLYEDGVFWFNVGEHSRKARNIRRNPDVSLTIDERTWPYKEVVVFGRAEEASFDEDQARRMAIRYVAEEEGQAMHRAMIAAQQRVRMRLALDRATWTDFSGWDYKSYAD